MTLYYPIKKIKFSGGDYIEAGFCKESVHPANLFYLQLKSREQNRIIELTAKEVEIISDLGDDVLIAWKLKEDGQIPDNALKWRKK